MSGESQVDLIAPPAPPVAVVLSVEPSYLLSGREYAARYGVDERTIKGWKTVGRRALPHPDYVPLDDPASMPAWWDRRMSKRAPDHLLALASQFSGAPSAPVRTDSPPLADSAAPPQEIRRDFSSVAALTMESQLEGLRRTVAISLQLLNEALANGIETVIAAKQTAFQRASESLRKVELTYQQMQEGRGELVSRADATSDIASLISALVAMRRRMAAQVVEKLPFLTADQRVQVAAAVEEIRAQEDQIFRSAARWTAPAHVEDLAAA